jgi:signal transduction histidine kinase
VPGLADLEGLLAEVAKAGLAVRLRVEGTPSPLPAGVDLSAYRIVQEALTNSLKHAGPARASVRLCYGREALEIQVWDDGPGPAPVGGGLAVVTLGPGGVLSVSGPRPAAGGGQGLIGMRERVALFGGTLEAGPRPGGGYRVAARLPLSEAL